MKTHPYSALTKSRAGENRNKGGTASNRPFLGRFFFFLEGVNMKYMTGKQIRNMWIEFFQSKGHSLEAGASLIPNDDPTLLWMNSGVAALKKYFDGSVAPKNPRMVNAQKCIRTNDIENVGKTARHHTFFEKIGRASCRERV